MTQDVSKLFKFRDALVENTSVSVYLESMPSNWLQFGSIIEIGKEFFLMRSRDDHQSFGYYLVRISDVTRIEYDTEYNLAREKYLRSTESSLASIVPGARNMTKTISVLAKSQKVVGFRTTAGDDRFAILVKCVGEWLESYLVDESSMQLSKFFIRMSDISYFSFDHPKEIRLSALLNEGVL